MTGICRRRLHRIPYNLRTGVIPEVDKENLLNLISLFLISKFCQKKFVYVRKLDALNQSIYFESDYDDLLNSQKHDYVISIDHEGHHVPNMEVNDTITDIHNSYFSVTRHNLSTFSKLNEGELLGNVSSILCAETDKNSKAHLNGSVTIPDIKKDNSFDS